MNWHAAAFSGKYEKQFIELFSVREVGIYDLLDALHHAWQCPTYCTGLVVDHLNGDSKAFYFSIGYFVIPLKKFIDISFTLGSWFTAYITVVESKYFSGEVCSLISIIYDEYIGSFNR